MDRIVIDLKTSRVGRVVGEWRGPLSAPRLYLAVRFGDGGIEQIRAGQTVRATEDQITKFEREEKDLKASS